MFAQGQLLGMQTDLLNRLKVEVNAWEKVAEKHPYSVYNKHELSGSYAAARANDKFTTSFGDGLPYRVYSRNERAWRALKPSSVDELTRLLEAGGVDVCHSPLALQPAPRAIRAVHAAHTAHGHTGGAGCEDVC